MKPLVALSLLVIILAVDGNHTFLGTNVQRPLLYHKIVKYSSNLFTKRIEHLDYSIPRDHSNVGKFIQGILAYDLTNTGASANVTAGGIGTTFVKLRMKSDRGEPLHYNVYIYA